MNQRLTFDTPATYAPFFRLQTIPAKPARPSSASKQVLLMLRRAACAGGHTGHAICHSMAKGVCVRVPPAFSGNNEVDGVGSLIAMDNGLSATIISTVGAF